MWKLPATLLRISEPNIRQASDGVDGVTDLKMTTKHSLFINPIKYKFHTINILKISSYLTEYTQNLHYNILLLDNVTAISSDHHTKHINTLSRKHYSQ